MPNVLTWENGQKVIREYDPAVDAPTVVTSDELDARADALADSLMERGLNETRAIGLTIAEIVFRISNGNVPSGLTEEQARQWVRNSIRGNYRALLNV